MLNFHLTTERDRREAASIERRRLFEEERKKRIFNPRNRLFGVDARVLDKQVAERQEKVLEERNNNKIFQDYLIKADEVAMAMDRKEKEERARLQTEINEYRKVYQRPEDRREFDLNDPNYIKKQIPMRLYDEDPRLGPSAAQKFEGEDIASDRRAKIQREEVRSWLDQQITEKNNADKERKAADDAYKAAVVARDMRAVQLDKMEKDCRKKLFQSCLRYNQALAEEKKCEGMKKDKETLQDNMAEIYNCMTSDLLTENPDVAKSNFGPNKMRATASKGMTVDEKIKFKEEQLMQIAEVKKQKELEARMNREMDDYLNGIQKTIYLMDREMELKQKEKNKKLAEDNKRLAEEQLQQKQFMEKVVFANFPTDEFYDQFNKTSR